MEKRRINVRAIIWHDNRLLAVKHKTKDGGEAEYWAVPGGGLDPKEALTDGITRELLEETGVKAEIGTLLFMQQFTSTRPSWDEELEFFYHITNYKDFLDIDLTKTTHGNQELARIEFIDPKNEYILPRFLSEVDIASAIENKASTQLFNELG